MNWLRVDRAIRYYDDRVRRSINGTYDFEAADTRDLLIELRDKAQLWDHTAANWTRMRERHAVEDFHH